MTGATFPHRFPKTTFPAPAAMVLACLAVGCWLFGCATQAAAAGLPSLADSAAQAAKELLDHSGVSGGLIVQVGCNDGKLAVALQKHGPFVVFGLDTDPADVDAAREFVRSQAAARHVLIERFDGKHLPLIDNQVNLLVAESLGELGREEVLRVLCPGGVALIGPTERREKIIKPRPENIDQWTHFLHGPDNNAVAQDEVVDFPFHMQWIGAPDHSRDHEITTSMDVMVSAGGRLFYIIDEGPTALSHYLPSRWHLVARDAFNGVVLWRRPLPEWRPYQVHGRTSLAADLWRRLVATEEAVYVTASIFGPVAALDPATGRTLHIYEGTERTEEILFDQGILYLLATTLDPRQIDRRQLAAARTTPDQKRLLAVRAASGEILWSKEDGDTNGVHPLTLAVKDGRVFFQNTKAVLCLDAASGRTLWRFARPTSYRLPGHTTPTLVVAEDVVLSAARTPREAPAAARRGTQRSAGCELIALSARDGHELWRCPCAENVGAGPDVFVADGLVWVGEMPRRAESDYNHGRDLHTGRIERSFSHAEDWPTEHHHRCYRDKATCRYILAGRTGIEFIDLKTGRLTPHYWTRGICEYGILPCNGLIYSPPDQCACYIQSKVHGFYALAPKRPDWEAPRSAPDDPPRLEHGPAFGALEKGKKTSSVTADPAADWPTFRHDNQRSGCAPVGLPTRPRVVWRSELGGRLTALVSAGGRLFGAQRDQRRVFCLDARSGRLLWQFEAGGRVDSPPTIARGLAVFGSHDGYVYALRASDGELVWRFRAAPADLRLVEKGQLASVWPVHGSVLVEGDRVYLAAGRSSYLDGGMYLYQLDLATGRPLIEKHYSSRDPRTGRRIELYTPFPGEVLPGREWPGLLPDIFSADADNLYLRSVPFTRRLEIRDKVYVPHLFGSLGFLEDSWWERTYWIYGSHFYSGARGHGYARTLYPGGRLLVFDEQSVLGYQDLELSSSGAFFFRVSKNPPMIDIAAELAGRSKWPSGKPRKGAAELSKEQLEWIRNTFVWKDGIPQNPQQMQLTAGKGTFRDAIRRITKFEYTWQRDVPLYPNALVAGPKHVVMAGPPRFDEQVTFARLSTAPTDRYRLDAPLQEGLETFAGRKGGLVLVVDKSTGETAGEAKLPSSPVFDGGSIIALKGGD